MSGGIAVGLDFEAARDKIDALVAWAAENVTTESRNEATTRLHLIDRLLFECLGWDREDCVAEEQYEGTYTDYSLGKPSRKLVVEAKKEGIHFELPAGFDKTTCKLKTLLDLDTGIDKAIRQAVDYCQKRGTPIGAVCNGHQLVAFIGSRQDGVAPLDGRALVFPSLETMRDKFKELWFDLSKSGVSAYNIFTTLLTDSVQAPPDRLSHRLVGYPGFKNRNPFQTELKTLGELFIEDIGRVPQLEDQFLKDCYASSGAVSQYALISRQVLEARYSLVMQKELQAPTLQSARVKDGVAAELTAELTADAISAGLKRRVIILLGDVGVGKSMFIRHLVRVDARSVFEKAINLYVDFGKEPALADDLERFVVARCEGQLRDHNVDVREREFIRGVYHGELLRFSRGIYADLKKIDEKAFLEKEIEFLASKLEDRAAHLRACLEHIWKAHKRQIVIFLDNVDQRPFEFQERAFLIGQSFAETWPATVFIALRPDTFYHSRTKGSLTAYQPRVFTISPPRIDVVIKKRLHFALGQLQRTGRLEAFPSNITINSQTLSRYMEVLLHSFEESEELNSFVDNLSGGNIRRALDFLNAFIGSGHVNAAKILDRYEQQGSYTISVHEFMRAVIFGDHEHYDPSISPIANLFDISTPDGREHFLLGNVIGFIERNASSSGQQGYVDAAPFYEFAQSLGFAPSQVNFAVQRAIDKKLIEPSPAFLDKAEAVAYRITTIGAYTIKQLCKYFSYVDAMIVDTPIVDDKTRVSIGDIDDIDRRLERATRFADYLDSQWQAIGHKNITWDWKGVSTALRADIDAIHRKRRHAREAKVRPTLSGLETNPHSK
jgi:hypothetical protein